MNSFIFRMLLRFSSFSPFSLHIADHQTNTKYHCLQERLHSQQLISNLTCFKLIQMSENNLTLVCKCSNLYPGDETALVNLSDDAWTTANHPDAVEANGLNSGNVLATFCVNHFLPIFPSHLLEIQKINKRIPVRNQILQYFVC